MKEIMNEVLIKNSRDNIYPVSMDGENYINFISTKEIDNYPYYKVYKYNCVTRDIKIGSEKHIDYTFLKNNSEMDLPILDFIDVR
jgi:hypothetical protein